MTSAAENIAFPVRNLQGARLSELARCPRMCAYGATGADRREPSELERRYFTRGRMFGEFVARQLAQRYGADQIEVERVIPWPHGEGHADVYVKPERLIVEVVSTVTPSTRTLEFKIWQARLYLHFDPEAEAAQVYVIDPSRLTRENVIPVELNDDHRQVIAAWVEQIGEAVSGTSLPDRVCHRPADARAHLCRFAETCFADWTEPPRPVALDSEVAALAGLHQQLVAREREAKAVANTAREERSKIEARLAEKVEPGEIEADQFVIRRTPVERPGFQLGRARAAGLWTRADDERFASCLSASEFDRWTITRQEGAEPVGLHTNEDYGEVPF